MQELNKKIIWNAVSAYMMVLVSITFLFSKQKYLDHPFVKSHVKSAFVLHLLLFLVWFVMSYDFLNSIIILTYSLNTIITAWLFLSIFWAILYGMMKAHKWETVTLWEIFHTASSGKNLVTKNTSENIQESDAVIMILSHVPFLGYIVGTRNKHHPHIRDILQLNLIATLIAALLLIFWYTSLANIVMLGYIIWSVAQSISLIVSWNIVSLNLDIFPTVEEKYLHQKSIYSYVVNTLKKGTFVPYKDIYMRNTHVRAQKEELAEKNIPYKNYYIIRNAISLWILFVACIYYFWYSSPVLILFLFPIFYLIWYSERKAYMMPYIYDMYAFISLWLYKIFHMFSRAKELKNTNTSQTIKIWEHSEKQEIKNNP